MPFTATNLGYVQRNLDRVFAESSNDSRVGYAEFPAPFGDSARSAVAGYGLGLLWGQCKRDIDGPFSKAFSQTAVSYSQLFRPFVEGLRYAVEGDKVRIALICMLFILRSPIAVFRGVAEAVISSVYGVFGGRARPHVRYEIFKNTPSFTYRYSSSAVMLKDGMVWIRAALAHSRPYKVFRGLAAAMFSFAFGHKLLTKTATTSGVPRTKYVRDSMDSVTTVAQTNPRPSLEHALRFTNDSEFAKPLTNYNSAFHEPIIACFRSRQ